jgi:hypothetical protein
MSERKLTDALTANDHFRQAGFRVLYKKVSPELIILRSAVKHANYCAPQYNQ